MNIIDFFKNRLQNDECSGIRNALAYLNRYTNYLDRETEIIEHIRSLAEIMVYADKKNIQDIFLYFYQKDTHQLLHHYLNSQCKDQIKIQIYQTVSIFLQNIDNLQFKNHLLNKINQYIQPNIDFDTDKTITSYYISFLKLCSLHITQENLHYFYDESPVRSFPLFICANNFFHDSDRMIQIVVQSINLNIFKINNPNLLTFLTEGNNKYYFINFVFYIKEGVLNLQKNYEAALGSSQNDVFEHLFLSILDEFYYIRDIFDIGAGQISSLLYTNLFSDVITPLSLVHLDSDDSSHENEDYIDPIIRLYLFAQFFRFVPYQQLVDRLFESLFGLGEEYVDDETTFNKTIIKEYFNLEDETIYTSLLFLFYCIAQSRHISSGLLEKVQTKLSIQSSETIIKSDIIDYLMSKIDIIPLRIVSLYYGLKILSLFTIDNTNRITLSESHIQKLDNLYVKSLNDIREYKTRISHLFDYYFQTYYDSYKLINFDINLVLENPSYMFDTSKTRSIPRNFIYGIPSSEPDTLKYLMVIFFLLYEFKSKYSDFNSEKFRYCSTVESRSNLLIEGFPCFYYVNNVKSEYIIQIHELSISLVFVDQQNPNGVSIWTIYYYNIARIFIESNYEKRIKFLVYSENKIPTFTFYKPGDGLELPQYELSLEFDGENTKTVLTNIDMNLSNSKRKFNGNFDDVEAQFIKKWRS